MGTLDEFLKEINFTGLVKGINSLDRNDPSFNSELKQRTVEFFKKLMKLVENSSVEVIIGVLDFFYLNYPRFVPSMLKSGNEKVIRAQLVIERIMGHDIDMLKNNIQELKDIEMYRSVMGMNDARSTKKREISEKVLGIIHEFIKDKDTKEWEEIIDKDLIKFAKNIGKVEKKMFDGSSHLYYNKFDFINKIFLMDDVDVSLLNDLYSNVLTKSKAFVAFDYSEIFKEKPFIIGEVKGLFKKFPLDVLDCTQFDKDDFEEFDLLLKEVCELNKDDEEGLRWFFLELNENILTNIGLISYLIKKDYFNYYTSKSKADIFDEVMIKMEQGNLDVDDNILQGLGTYNKFVDNFPKYLDLVINGNDEFIKKYSIPVIVALIEKQRITYGLDFKIIFTKKKLDNDTGGSYNFKENTLYINPYFLIKDEKVLNNFVFDINAVFHETRHAIQRKELLTSNKFSYDNLVMAMDMCLLEFGGRNYYESNYKQLSLELDAREVAYVRTMDLLKPYPKAQEMNKKNIVEEQNPLVKFMRKSIFSPLEMYYGIVDHFINQMNDLLNDTKEEDYLEYIFSKLESFPVLTQFMDIDRNRKRIRIKPNQYFNQKMKEADSLSDPLEKEEIYYSVSAIRYAANIDAYFRDRYGDVHNEGKDEYNQEILEGVLNNVGEAPYRRKNSR